MKASFPFSLRYIAITVGLSTLLVVTGCKPEKEKGNFSLELKGYVGSQPLSFTNTFYNDGVNKEFFFSKLKFFLSDIYLIKEDNTELKIQDVAFFDFDDNRWRAMNAEVPAGTYKGIRFHVGLSPEQNNANPDAYPVTDPRGPKDDMYWEWLKHRFVNLEGTADTLGQNFSGGVVGLVYHVGRDTCYREVSLTGTTFTVQEGSVKNMNLELDLLKLFKDTPNAIDMFQVPGTQSEDADLHIAIRFADLFAQTFSYSEQ